MSLDDHDSRLFTFWTLQLPAPSFVSKLVVFSYHWMPPDQVWFGADVALTLPTALTHLEAAWRALGVPQTLYVRSLKPFATPSKRWALPLQRMCAWAGCTPHAANRRHVSYGKSTAEEVLLGAHWESLDACRQSLTQRAAQHNGREPLDSAACIRQPPQQPYLHYEAVPCRVLVDGFIRFRNCFYSVPRWKAGQTLWVRCQGDEVSIESASGDVLAQHRLSRCPLDVRMNLDHFVQTRQDPQLSHLYRAFLHAFPQEELFLACLLAQRRFGAAEALQAILRSSHSHPRETLRRVFHRCYLYNNFSYPFLAALLAPAETRSSPQPRLETGRLF